MEGRLVAGTVAVRREIVEVPFREGTIQAVRGDGGDVFVIPKWVCEQLGLDWGSQFRKLKGCHWATIVMMTTVDPNGREREHCVLPLRALPMWLATIDVRKVAAEIKEKLVAYQLEAVDVLHDYFFGKPAAAEAKKELSLLDQARLMVAVLEQQEGLRKELGHIRSAVDDGREVADYALDIARDAETKATAAICHANLDPGYMSLLGYCKRHGLELTLSQMAAEGKALAKACRLSGTRIGTVGDQRCGDVNTYPVSVLDRWRKELRTRDATPSF